MKTLEQYLRDNIIAQTIDFRIRASIDVLGLVSFYIHPDGKDGDTLDFYVSGDSLSSAQEPEHIPWYLLSSPHMMVMKYDQSYYFLWNFY